MRYLKNRQTNEVRLIDDNDDTEFYALLAQRDDDRRQIWVQTGPQDPDVQDVELPGQSPGNTGGSADLNRLKRADLDTLATERGVPDPAGLPNKQAVIDAINALTTE